MITVTVIITVIRWLELFKQSCYQGLSLRDQGQDFFLKAKAKDKKIFQGQRPHNYLKANIKANWDSCDYEPKFALQ